eukprot:g56742.t1
MKPPTIVSKVLNISCDGRLNDNTVTFGAITYEINVSFPEISVEPVYITQSWRVGIVIVPMDILPPTLPPAATVLTFPNTTSSDAVWKLADRIANPNGAVTNNLVSWRVTVLLKDNAAIVDGGILQMTTKVGAGSAANVISTSTRESGATFAIAGNPDAGEKGKLTLTISETEGSRAVLYGLATELVHTTPDPQHLQCCMDLQERCMPHVARCDLDFDG